MTGPWGGGAGFISMEREDARHGMFFPCSRPALLHLSPTFQLSSPNQISPYLFRCVWIFQSRCHARQPNPPTNLLASGVIHDYIHVLYGCDYCTIVTRLFRKFIWGIMRSILELKSSKIITPLPRFQVRTNLRMA